MVYPFLTGSYASPGACARLTRRLVRLMEDIAGG